VAKIQMALVRAQYWDKDRSKVLSYGPRKTVPWVKIEKDNAKQSGTWLVLSRDVKVEDRGEISNVRRPEEIPLPEGIEDPAEAFLAKEHARAGALAVDAQLEPGMSEPTIEVVKGGKP